MDRHIIDKEQMGKAIYDFPDHLQDALEIGSRFNPKNKFQHIQNIVVAGMGGSAIGGDICVALFRNEIHVPVFVSRNYSVPNWVNEKTMVICSSYSGNTEETLSAFEDAKRKNAQICGITTGGEILKKFEELHCDFIEIPAGLQPRAALAYSLIPMLVILKNQGIIKMDFHKEIQETISLLRNHRDVYFRENTNNPALSLAKKLYKTIPIIYGTSGSTAIAALRWKGQFCENADMLAYHNELPEMNHNEIVGWENNVKAINQLSIVWLRDLSDHERINLRQEITGEILMLKTKNQHSITVEGSTEKSRFFHMIHFGDWVSYWCAILHGTNPSPVKPIMKLKHELSS